MAFEQRHSGCSNSLNPKCALREAVAPGSPKVLHWLLSSVGELCTPRHNSCDRHLPGFSTTTHKTKCTFQSPALVSTSCHDSSLIVLCFLFFFSTSRETHTKKTEKPKSCISHRQLKHIIASVSKGTVLLPKGTNSCFGTFQRAFAGVRETLRGDGSSHQSPTPKRRLRTRGNAHICHDRIKAEMPTSQLMIYFHLNYLEQQI